jgi:hypothetical protein
MLGKYVSNWRVIVRLTLVLIVMAVGAEAGRMLHLRINARTNAQDVRRRLPVPYTVTLREIIHAPDGTTRVSREITQAFRQDGSRVTISSTYKGSGRALYFSSGHRVDINESDSTKTSTMDRDPNPNSWQRDPNSNCLNSFDGRPFDSDQKFLGEETISGYRAAKISSGIITSWHALDYGCALLKDRWQYSPTEVTEKELVALVGGEPDAALFDVSAKYREVSPSERILGPNKQHRPCNESGEKLLRMMDEDYKRNATVRDEDSKSRAKKPQ